MKVSVIIPTYNEEKDIADCLKSLKKQSYHKLEVILVDDGSTDNTLEIAKKTAKTNKLIIKTLKQDHGGPGKARNLGAKKANGEILVFVDSDMTFDKDYIQNLISPILKDKEGKIIGTTHDYEIATNTDKWTSDLWGKIRVSKEDAKNVKIFRAIRKNKFIEFGGFDSKYGYADDQTFFFKYGIKPTVAPDTLCYHRNPDNLKGTYKQARWIGASWKERFTIFKIPLVNYVSVIVLFIFLPILITLKSLKTRIKSKYSLGSLVDFYTNKFLGYAIGVSRAVFLGRVWK